MKRNKIVILYKKGPPVFNYPIWHLKGQYAMILLPIGTENCFSRWQKEKRNVPHGHLDWKDKKSTGNTNISGGFYYQNYSSTSVPSPSARIADLKNSSNAFSR